MEKRLGIFALLVGVFSMPHPGTRAAGGRPGAHMSLATFNTGLTPRVAEYSARREEILHRLTERQADVVCLQEVWSSLDLTRIVDATVRVYPFTFSALHDDVSQVAQISRSEAPCRSSAVVMEFLRCYERQCLPASSQSVAVTCARLRCDLMSLTQQCITCLVLADPATAINSCLQAQGTQLNVPGLLLLSNLPLANVSVTRYAARVKILLPRAYISAEVEGIGTVICTHTTANLGTTYFEVLDYASWEEQNLDEARAVVRSLEHVQHAVVMGDLNSSPAVAETEVSADMEGSFQYFLDRGYTSPYTDRLGICTWCKYNSIAHARRNLILDHILLKNHRSVAAMRLFDCRASPLSDHFGIKLILENPSPPSCRCG